MAADTGQAALFDVPAAPGETLRDAVISDDETYRYVLTRRWDDGPLLIWVMLNPSIADARIDDPTIVRCVRRALRWKQRGIPYGGIRVLNLFALRATDPAALRTHPGPCSAATETLCGYPVGPDNDRWLTRLADDPDAGTVVAAWGIHGHLHGRDTAVRKLLAGVPLHCLGVTAGGQPKHPLLVAYDTPLIPWET
jgi:hypothetical protein